MIRILAVFTTLLTRLQIFQQIGSTVCLNDGRSECKMCIRDSPCTVKTIENLIYSDFSQSYHPIREYFELLPEWDGTDYIRILADSVQTSHQEFWAECLERYLVAMCAAATQENLSLIHI